VERAVSELAELARGGTLVAIVGPTASGKTALAVEVAERVGGEIVSADSVQVYRGFDVGSGKPTAEERARAPHHLVDVLDPMDPMDASRFVAMADAAIDDVRRRGRVPIVCGGTFLWVKALLQGLAAAPPADEAVRARHRALADAEGRAALHARLRAVDARSAERLHPNDLLRVSRALEVFELTGEPMSVLQERHAFRTARHEARLFALRLGPDVLRARIEARVDAWLRAGWLDEVRALVASGFAGARAMGSVGYKELAAHVAEGRGEPTPELREKIVQSTRIFARRQRTWLNHEPVTWLG
jgi:tRNA dimethylallyltransferase